MHDLQTLLAHQGGWDEILLVAGPLAVFGGVLYVANKRASAKLAAQGDADEGAEAGQVAETPEGV